MQSTNLALQVGKKLKLARIESELTQAEVGKKMYCSTKVIARMEAGDREPSVTELNQLAEIYKKPITFFFSSLEALPSRG